MRVQTGAAPLKRATIVVEWESEPGTDEAVRVTLEEHADSLVRSLEPLRVTPTVSMVLRDV